MYIISISVKTRTKEIPDVQSLLTEYGDRIHTRLGIHNPKEETEGLIIIVYKGEDIEEFVEKLNATKSVEVNYMEV